MEPEAQSEAGGYANGSALGAAKSLVASKPGRLCMITNKKLQNVHEDGFILIGTPTHTYTFPSMLANYVGHPCTTIDIMFNSCNLTCCPRNAVNGTSFSSANSASSTQLRTTNDTAPHIDDDDVESRQAPSAATTITYDTWGATMEERHRTDDDDNDTDNATLKNV